MNRFEYKAFVFDGEENNTITTQDLAPAISIDMVYAFKASIEKLKLALGITNMRKLDRGSTIKIYKTTKVNEPEQVGEGEVVPLTKFQRKLVKTIEVALKKERKSTSGEAIQNDTFDVAVNETDEKMIGSIGTKIKKAFFSMINEGAGTAEAGADLQTAISNLWAALEAGIEDETTEGTTVFFVNPFDVSGYLAKAQITTQEAFGLSYLKNFMGMGTLIISKDVAKGKPAATISDNLKGAFISMDGELSVFGYSTDETGLIGMTHSLAQDRVSVDSHCAYGTVFYPEDTGKVYVGSITQG